MLGGSPEAVQEEEVAMYVCNPCFEKNPDLIRGVMTANGGCEWCGHFEDNWTSKHVQWVKNVRRPVGHANPKKYILDQLRRPEPPEHFVVAVHEASVLTATRVRDWMEGFRNAMAGSEDPYKKGQHDAYDFMIRQIDQDLERNRT
jgi:hypothetical protein